MATSSCEAPAQSSLIKPFALTHGTAECYDLKLTRRFYEDILGLECVRHAPSGMVLRLGSKFHIVVLQTGDELRPCALTNHWGLDVATKAEVDEAHAKISALKAEFGLAQILAPQMQHGVYSFYFEDMNHVWWEIEHYDGCLHDDFFDFGDQFQDPA